MPISSASSTVKPLPKFPGPLHYNQSGDGQGWTGWRLEAPESTDLEAQRAELEAVLHSEHFTRAPTLAHLLSYLCERLFAGEASQIKEYSVGVEVFHRGSSFDQDSDSIVRVEANRLRKRLAAYYAGEGASHRLHITIPLGQYVPRVRIGGFTAGGRHSRLLLIPRGARARHPARDSGFVCQAAGPGGLSPRSRFCLSASAAPC